MAKERDRKLERARVRVSTMLSLADALGAGVGPDEIRRAALVPLTPTALCSAVMAANLILVLGEKLAFTLAGLVDDKVLAKLLGTVP